jgi:hypothetical protein
MLTQLILLVNVVAAAQAVYQWIKNPDSGMHMVIGLICGIVSVATAQYTPFSIAMLLVFVIILVLVQSGRLYTEYEKHIVQAQIHFNGPPRSELSKLVKRVFAGIRKAKAVTELAKGLEQVARMGEDYQKAESILVAAAKLSTALDDSLVMCVSLLIRLDRFFRLNGQYETVADKVVVTARHGVQIGELSQAFDAYNQNSHRIYRGSIDEFLSMLIVLARSEIRGGPAGSSLAGIVNTLSGVGGIETAPK